MTHRSVATVLAATLASACASPGPSPEVIYIDFDGPVFESVEALADQSPITALIRLGDVVSRQSDDGGDPANPGLPVVVIEFEVVQTLAGDQAFGPDDPLHIVMVDPSLVVSDRTAEVAQGAEYLAFLIPESSLDRPGLDLRTATYFSLMGMNNGLLEATGDRFVPTGEYPWALTEAQTELRRPSESKGADQSFDRETVLGMVTATRG